MATLAYLDTHVVIWLYAAGAAGIPAGVARFIEQAADLRISPMVRLELQYLYEVGRLTETPVPVLDALQAVLPLSICAAPFQAVVREAEGQQWTRDSFDRLIVAQANLLEAPLVTKDDTIRRHYPRACWPEDD